MTRARILLAVVALAILATLPVPAAAQTSSVRLLLRSAPTWNGPDFSDLSVDLRAVNAGTTTYGDLSVELTLRSRVGSRSAYDAAFLQGRDAGRVIASVREDRPGEIAADGSRQLTVSFDLADAGLDPDNSGIYPLRIELRSGESSLGVIRLPVVYLVRPPINPVRLAWSVVLDAPIHFLPRGAFADDSLADDLRPNGRIGDQIEALGAFASLPTNAVVDLVVSPLLLEQLDRMRRGYAIRTGPDPADVRAVAAGEGGARLAEFALDSLAFLVTSNHIRLGLMPYAAPSLPSLVASGLADDVGAQLEAGADVVEELLGVRPDPSVVRPPGSAIDGATLAILAAGGTGTLILDAGTIELPEQPLGFAPPAEVSLDAGGAPIAGLAPDPAIATLLSSFGPGADPVLAAHVAVGELAAIWQEAPGTDRTLAIALTEESAATLPVGFHRPFMQMIAVAPWLRTRGAATIAADLTGTQPTAELAPQVTAAFPRSYVDAIAESRRRVGVLGSMLVEDGGQSARLQRLLLLAESAAFLDDPKAGAAFVEIVDIDTTSLLGSIRTAEDQQVTLTSSESALPIPVQNIAPQALRAIVRVVSQHIREPVEQEITLGPGERRVLSFDVALRSSGRFPMQVQLVAPTGEVVTTTPLFVRSTELNRQALAIVIGAGLLLVVLWLRRLARVRSAG